MKFHIIAAALLSISGFLVYILLFGLHSELESARETIQVESVKSLREDKKVQANDKYAPYINQVLVQPAVVAQKEEALAEVAPGRAAPVEQQAEQRFLGEKTYWCKSVPVNLERSPVRCVYPDSCYGCSGPIIRPEYQDSVPLCGNGLRSQLYHVECCPSFASNDAQCPLADQCFQDDSVPSSFCTCNNRPECRLVDIGGQIQCVCIDH